MRYLRYQLPLPATSVDAIDDNTVLLGLSLSWPWPDRTVVAEASGLINLGPQSTHDTGRNLAPTIRCIGSSCGPIDVVRWSSGHPDTAIAVSQHGITFVDRLQARCDPSLSDGADPLLSTVESSDGTPDSPMNSLSSSHTTTSDAVSSPVPSTKLASRLLRNFNFPAPPLSRAVRSAVECAIDPTGEDAWWVLAGRRCVARLSAADWRSTSGAPFNATWDRAALWRLPRGEWCIPRSGGVGAHTVDAVTGAAGSCVLVDEASANFVVLEPRCPIPAWRARIVAPWSCPCRGPAALFLTDINVLGVATLTGEIALFDVRRSGRLLPVASTAVCDSSITSVAQWVSRGGRSGLVAACGDQVRVISRLPVTVRDTPVFDGSPVTLAGRGTSVAVLGDAAVVSDTAGFISVVPLPVRYASWS